MNEKPDNADRDNGQIDCQVIQLLREYFANKRQLKELKKQRIEYRKTNGCEGEDCIADGTKEEDFCDVCKQRHEYHKQILKLNYRNNGIMNIVRAKVV